MNMLVPTDDNGDDRHFPSLDEAVSAGLWMLREVIAEGKCVDG